MSASNCARIPKLNSGSPAKASESVRLTISYGCMGHALEQGEAVNAFDEVGKETLDRDLFQA